MLDMELVARAAKKLNSLKREQETVCSEILLEFTKDLSVKDANEITMLLGMCINKEIRLKLEGNRKRTWRYKTFLNGLTHIHDDILKYYRELNETLVKNLSKHEDNEVFLRYLNELTLALVSGISSSDSNSRKKTAWDILKGNQLRVIEHMKRLLPGNPNCKKLSYFTEKYKVELPVMYVSTLELCESYTPNVDNDKSFENLQELGTHISFLSEVTKNILKKGYLTLNKGLKEKLEVPVSELLPTIRILQRSALHTSALKWKIQRTIIVTLVIFAAFYLAILSGEATKIIDPNIVSHFDSKALLSSDDVTVSGLSSFIDLIKSISPILVIFAIIWYLTSQFVKKYTLSPSSKMYQAFSEILGLAKKMKKQAYLLNPLVPAILIKDFPSNELEERYSQQTIETHMSRALLQKKNTELDQSNREKSNMLELYKHTFRHISYPCIIKDVAEALFSDETIPPEQLKFMSSKLTRAYQSEQVLTQNIALLQHLTSPEINLVRNTFRIGVKISAVSKSPKVVGIRELFENSLDLVVMHLMMEDVDQSDRMRSRRSQILKNINSLLEDYSVRFLAKKKQDLTLLKWVQANLFNFVITISDEWENIRIGAGSFASAQITAIFVELLTNFILHGENRLDLNLKSTERTLDICLDNDCPEGTYLSSSGQGVNLLKMVIEKINYGSGIQDAVTFARSGTVYSIRVKLDKTLMYKVDKY